MEYGFFHSISTYNNHHIFLFIIVSERVVLMTKITIRCSATSFKLLLCCGIFFALSSYIHRLAHADEIIYPTSFYRTALFPGVNFGSADEIVDEYNLFHQERYDDCLDRIFIRGSGTCTNFQIQSLEPEGRLVNELPMSYVSHNLRTVFSLNPDGSTHIDQQNDVNNIRINRFLTCPVGTVLQITPTPTGDIAECRVL